MRFSQETVSGVKKREICFNSLVFDLNLLRAPSDSEDYTGDVDN
jgi:hypothetical protein